MRIKWEYAPCDTVNVVAQQMENSLGVNTFRQWNPEREDVAYGEDNGSSTETSCPVTCICCFLVEKIFKAVFQETIDVLIIGNENSSKKVLDDLEE